MTADLTPAQAARLEAIEAAPWAEEAAVERVARALWLAEEDVFGWVVSPWDRISETTRDQYRRLAVAAIDVMRGATDDGATFDMEAACEPVARQPKSVRRFRATPIGAPATAEGDDRGQARDQ